MHTIYWRKYHTGGRGQNAMRYEAHAGEGFINAQYANNLERTIGKVVLDLTQRGDLSARIRLVECEYVTSPIKNLYDTIPKKGK